MARLRSFQREDIDYIKKNEGRCLIASAPGTGKTPVAIRALVETHLQSLPAVVVCPASVTENWAREFKIWGPGVKTVVISDGATKLPKPTSPNVVYILSWALLGTRHNTLRQLGIKSLVADESHYIKSQETQRAKAFYCLARGIKRIMLLTGTPIVNTEVDLAVLKEVLGDNPPMIRRLIEDVAPDIPEKKRSYLYVKMRKHAQCEYDRADSEFEDWLQKEREKLVEKGLREYDLERTLAAEALIKVGYLRRLVGVAKANAAADWIARAVRLGEPVVVFLEHQAVLHKLSKALWKQRIRHCIIEGKTTVSKRQKAIDDFQAHKYPVFLGTKAAKEGITLTAARHLLFVERFFTAADEEQMEDRIRRIGQRHKTTIWFLHLAGTVDDRIDEIVKAKRHIVKTAIGSKDVLETPVGNVESLIQQWSKHTKPKDVTVTSLGLGPPLPALPSPKKTHALVFKRPRWNPKSAFVWCKMNGYRPFKCVDLKDRFKLIVHPAQVFRKAQFDAFIVCKDIKVIHGNRLVREQERIIRASMRG